MARSPLLARGAIPLMTWSPRTSTAPTTSGCWTDHAGSSASFPPLRRGGARHRMEHAARAHDQRDSPLPRWSPRTATRVHLRDVEHFPLAREAQEARADVFGPVIEDALSGSNQCRFSGVTGRAARASGT